MPILSDLLKALPLPCHLTGDPATTISAPVVESADDVEPGGVFVARPGASVDGHQFIPRALERGVAAIVGQRDAAELGTLPVPYVQVENAMEAVGWLAGGYHGHPSHRLTVIGVTGTDGKTTTSTILHSILQVATGGKCGLISTVSAVIGDQTLDTGLHVTTPGAPLVHALLARMVAAGLTHVVLEMTSHGLAQGRLNGVAVDAAVMTNVTHEHLDYHGTFEAYRAAKSRLFAMLGESPRKPGIAKLSVVNADDPSADFFTAFAADRKLTYGVDRPADVRGSDIVHRPGYTQFVVRGQKIDRLFHLPLVGSYNVRNALAALTAARGLGVVRDTLEKGILSVPPIPGRMERIDAGQSFLAIVDFAHTPNALATALKAARELTGPGGRVITVFGCAGMRDREKRRLMPEASARLADFTVMTAEDPRTESLGSILVTMAEAATAAGGVEGQTFIRVPDRGQALLTACRMARAGDVVIACGKGHEQSMAFGTTEYAWDDRVALRAALQGDPPRNLPTAPDIIGGT
ncbi:MAG: UDP-N-acetylmuramoyl-L-alanyl-D-glutamate--2,6-diaminopimelate ligase [Chloroflexi bacterium]|nr:UDP-N-acetylmuramoyl-L-alanyl-D-glutamate--2,6-diaminopimelate ligase [Chloroflexota bacterium]